MKINRSEKVLLEIWFKMEDLKWLSIFKSYDVIWCYKCIDQSILIDWYIWHCMTQEKIIDLSEYFIQFKFYYKKRYILL